MTSAENFPTIKANEKIIFLGDSITEMGDNPQGYVDIVRKELKRSSPTIIVEAAGVSGDKVGDVLERVNRDILAKTPNRVIIFIGINDVWGFYGYLGTSKMNFDREIRKLIEMLKPHVPHIAICTLSVIGEKKGGNPLDSKLDEYSSIIRKIASDENLKLIDLRAAFTDYLMEHNPSNNSSGILTSDEVHLNEHGNKLVAREMLKILNLQE